MADAAEPIRQPQMVKLWAAAREVGLLDHELHKLAETLTGKTSLRALTMTEAGRVIDELVKRGATSGRRQSLPPGVPRLVTPWQLERIADYIQQLGWSKAAPLYEGVIKRAIGRKEPRTSAEAAKVIEAFKAVLTRRQAQQEGQR